MPIQQPNSFSASDELATIRHSAREAIVTSTLEGVVTTWNRAATVMFGYEEREMVGQSLLRLVPPERRHLESEIVEGVRRDERTENYETRRIFKDGHHVEVSVTFAPIHSEAGRVIGLLSLYEDIGERKRLELAKRDQLFLEAIISSADDAIIGKDLNGIVNFWNPGAEKLFGYTAEEMIGKSITLLIPEDQPDEEPQILQRIRRGQKVEHYETRRRRKDGQIIDISMTISPIQDRLGRIIGAFKVAREITDRKRLRKAEMAESFLVSIVDSAEDAIIGKTLDGIVVSWNPAAERLFGYSAADMIGKPITILVPQDHPDEEAQILERIRRGVRIEHYETTRVRKDGRCIEVAQTISPVRDSLGQVIGVSNITRDVREQKQLQRREVEALRQAQEATREAEQASRAKDDFLATVSHELRTPMTAILGWSRMLLRGELEGARQRKAIETIDRNARSQAQLIEDLLDISRIVSGRLRIDYQPADLANIIAATVETVQPAAESKNIRIQTIVSSGAGPILGDTERLQQVVWNLLSNALKFTPKGGLVQIELKRVESQVELRVTDNGIGIRADFLSRLFNRFSQADSSITRNRGGLGMGLAIVKSLVELHGGVVSATSAGQNLGSSFVVKLPVSPISREPEKNASKVNPLLSAPMRENDSLVGIKLLVVDDDADTCDLLKFVFQQTGAIVETADSTEAALRMFDKWRPDILVSDIGMPKVDGYELIRVIRQEKHSRIPAVALTAMSRIDDRVRVLTAGYQMHVAKPVEPVELISIVSSLVGLINTRPLDS